MSSLEAYEIEKEENGLYYHRHKNSGDWLEAKFLVSNSWVGDNLVFMEDMLANSLPDTDSLDNVNMVIFNDRNNKVNYVFKDIIAKYFLENFKVPAYQSTGLFSVGNSSTNNNWSFKICILTSDNMYMTNGYVARDILFL